MFVGKLEAIYFSEQSGIAMTKREDVDVLAGQGIVGDRYTTGVGKFAKPGTPENEITLIEAEAVEAVPREYDFELTAAETRRNLVTRGVPLNHLINVEFQVGDVRLRGLELCEPCSHLAKFTGKAVVKALRHRGGLRACVLNDGRIRVGDEIRVKINN